MSKTCFILSNLNLTHILSYIFDLFFCCFKRYLLQCFKLFFFFFCLTLLYYLTYLWLSFNIILFYSILITLNWPVIRPQCMFGALSFIFSFRVVVNHYVLISYISFLLCILLHFVNRNKSSVLFIFFCLNDFCILICWSLYGCISVFYQFFSLAITVWIFYIFLTYLRKELRYLVNVSLYSVRILLYQVYRFSNQ